MRRVVVLSSLILGALGGGAEALAAPNLNSEDGLLFDFYAESSGYMSNGTTDAYDGCYDLTINGTAYNAGGAHEDYYGGRGWRAREHTIGDLVVRRHGYVPETGPSYARYIDTVRNDGNAAVNVTFRYHCNLGSDGGSNIVATEDGDATMEATDAWAETDDGDLGGDPSLGHVFFQPGAEVTMSSLTYQVGDIVWEYQIAIGPGETAAIMIFGIQQNSRADAHTDVLGAVDLEDPALAEVGDEFGYVRNFVMGGAPLLRSGGPYEVNEGACIPIQATAEDREGDAVTIAWDLDNDGTYETDDAAAEFCATNLDGPSTATVGIIAVDEPGNVVERDVAINVVNVDPIVASAPPFTAVAGAHYEHQFVIEDPGGVNDPITYTLTNTEDDNFPLGLTISATGLVSWDPLEFQAGLTYRVELTVDDGDDGEADVHWDIELRSNTAPTAPQPIYPTLTDPPVSTLRPTLIASNAEDADGDVLTYTFRIADNVGFVNAVVSPEIPAGALGATEWPISYDLTAGLSYYWKVQASDGIDVSEEGFSSFQVADDAGGDGDADADADADTDVDVDADGDSDDGGGGGGRANCACRTTGASTDLPSLALLALAGCALVWRRRR